MSLQGLGFAAAGALGEVVPPHIAITFAGIAGLVVVALLRPRPRDLAGRESRELRGEAAASPRSERLVARLLHAVAESLCLG